MYELNFYKLIRKLVNYTNLIETPIKKTPM